MPFFEGEILYILSPISVNEERRKALSFPNEASLDRAKIRDNSRSSGSHH